MPNLLKKKLNLKFPDKAVVVSSNIKLAKWFQTEMKKTYGVSFQIAKHARDLGITYTAACKRPSNILNNRQQKIKHRAFETIQIAKNKQKGNTIIQRFRLSRGNLGTSISRHF